MSLFSVETVLVIVGLLYSIVLHEVAHGYMAEQAGDPTARHAGRLTLNPIPHLDLFGSFLLPLLLIVTQAGFVFGYAKPVPYNPNMMRNRRWDPIKTMAAGPATNIVLAVMLGLFIRAMFAFGIADPAMVGVLSQLVIWNLILAIFNLTPIPPFDGRFLIGLFSPIAMIRAEIAMARMGGMGWLIGFLVAVFLIFPVAAQLMPPLFRLMTGISLF